MFFLRKIKPLTSWELSNNGLYEWHAETSYVASHDAATQLRDRETWSSFDLYTYTGKAMINGLYTYNGEKVKTFISAY